jgi:hypothetical protein
VALPVTAKVRTFMICGKSVNLVGLEKAAAIRIA